MFSLPFRVAVASSLSVFLRVPGRSGSAISLISVTQGLLFLAFLTDPTMLFHGPRSLFVTGLQGGVSPSRTALCPSRTGVRVRMQFGREAKSQSPSLSEPESE